MPKTQGSGSAKIYKADPKPLKNMPDPTGRDDSFDSQMAVSKASEESGETGSAANEPNEE